MFLDKQETNMFDDKQEILPEDIGIINSSNIDKDTNLNQVQYHTIERPQIKSNKTVLFIFVILGILIIGLGVFAYSYYSKQNNIVVDAPKIEEVLPTPPEDILQIALTNTLNAKSLEYDGSIVGNLQSSTDSRKRKLEFSGSANFDGEYKYHTNFTFTTEEPGTPSDWILKAEVKLLNDIKYFKFSSIKNGTYQFGKDDKRPRFYDASLYFYESPILDTGSVYGYIGWISYDLNKKFQDIKNKIEKDGDEESKEIYKNIKSIDGYNAQKRKKQDDNKDAFLKYIPIKLSEKFDIQKIDDTDLFHYSFSVDNENLKLLYKEISGDYNEDQNHYCGLLYETLGRPFGWSTIEFFMSFVPCVSMDDNLIDQIKGEIWIDTKELLIKKIIFDAPLIQEAMAQNQKDETGNIKIEANFKNFNKGIELIEIPEFSISAENLALSKSSLLVENGIKALEFDTDDIENSAYTDLSFSKEEIINLLNRDNFEDKTDTDNDGIVDPAENNFFGTNFNNSDTDGDGYSDRVEIEGGYNPNGMGNLK